MATQLQVEFPSSAGSYREWCCDGETNRNQPTREMKENARFHRQQGRRVRFTTNRSEFVR